MRQQAGLNYHRRHSSVVQIGEIPLGGNFPIRVQTMADVSTTDIEASVDQTLRVCEAGAEYMRFTAQGVLQAEALQAIRQLLDKRGCHIPLVADIHFSPPAAFEAIKHVEKVRINPGNFAEKKVPEGDLSQQFLAEAHRAVTEKFGALVDEAMHRGKALRIGVNHGSLSQRMMRLWGDTPEGMCQSALEYLRICKDRGYKDVVISMKSSNPLVMTEAVRLLVEMLDEEAMPFPLHLGVTEAGESEDGRIKSAIGIGSLLADGIGDTIRVSLTEPPEAEIPVAKLILDHIQQRAKAPAIEPIEDAVYTRGSYRREQLIALPPFSGAGTTPPLWIQGTQVSKALSPSGTADLSLSQSDNLTESFNRVFGPGKRLYTIDCEMLTDTSLSEIDKECLLLLTATTKNRIGVYRRALAYLASKGIKAPIILGVLSEAATEEQFIIEASIDLGALLIEGAANGIYLRHDGLPLDRLQAIGLGILQATRLRFSRAEFISCPGCGRTLYNLQETIAQIKASFGHLSNVKIGVMGCIVNGPGEMADADYGYVGGAPGRIDLYKGSQCLARGVPEDHAVEALEALIRREGDWKERTEDE